MFLNTYLSALILFILIQFLQTLSYARRINPTCYPSSCGVIPNITYHFRLTADPPHCGVSDYQILCENNTAVLYLFSRRYYVQTINYYNYTIRLVDAAVDINETCSFLQYSEYAHINLPSAYPYSTWFVNLTENYIHIRTAQQATFFSCPHPVNHSFSRCQCPHPVKHYFYINTTNDRCDQRSTGSLNSSSSANSRYMYIKVGNMVVSDVGDLCTIDVVTFISMSLKIDDNVSLSELHAPLLYGFEFSWFSVFCGEKCTIGSYCALVGNKPVCIHLNDDSWSALILATRILIGMPSVLTFLINKYRTRHLSMFDGIERFLQSENNLTPIRYSYSDIKKITKGFRQKLGKGGYGSVYKGKLRSGRDVAVKVLSSKSSANGQDFINEVSTIGRIHHVNVIKLVGFSAEGSKRALVYDFMFNGSLEKFIFSQDTQNSLNWKKKYDIAVGVARGIEYLHGGCDVQILHFDIKPHNILLDNDFTPKISDFGLAKFYSTDKNNVTLSAARGTIGYVAPELINRCIGSVSYKADVYSFGMMLMEMLGLKRDLVENAENSSLHFPYWIYHHLNRLRDSEIGNVEEITVACDNDDDKITRKMGTVALWCIQMNPDDRPTMSKVLEMLEGEVGSLQIPPQPASYSAQIAPYEDQTWGTSSCNDSITLLSHDKTT